MRQVQRLSSLMFAVAAFLAQPSSAFAADPAVTIPGAGSGKSVWFRDCPNCPELVVVPPVDASAKPFAIGRFAVTFTEWDACVDEGGCNARRPADEGWGRGNRPVINVNWKDAQAFAAWLSRKSGKSYRLPTKAEREHAGRAGTKSAFWWGDDIDLDRANYDVPQPARRMPGGDYSEFDKVRFKTVPVDSFAANPWGLYNVHGNIWEWTSDCAAAPGPVAVEPQKPAATCGERASLGGSWNDFATEAQAGKLMSFAADSRNSAQGFRLVRELP